MLRKFLSLLMVAVLINVAGIGAVCAQSEEDKQVAVIAKIRESVRKLGEGEAARVDVKLKNGTKLKGYILEARDDSSFLSIESPAPARR